MKVYISVPRLSDESREHGLELSRKWLVEIFPCFQEYSRHYV